MKKILKIWGIVLCVIVVLAVSIIVWSSLNSKLSSTSSFQSGGGFKGVANQDMGLSSSLSTDSVRSEKMMTSPMAPSFDTDNEQDQGQVEKRIIKNGDLNLKVDDTDSAAEKISGIAESNGGEVFSSNFHQGSRDVKSGILTLKVPVVNFEKTFAEIKKIASLVIRESTSGQDVTEQFIDLKAQLTNRQAEEQSFLRILDQAQKIDDVLAVTRELARVRGNIEQLQGSIKYLESQTDMSTISVNLTEDENITIVDSWRPWQIVKEALNSLVKGLQGFVDSIIRFVVIVVPFLIIWGIITWLVYKLGKKVYFRIKK